MSSPRARSRFQLRQRAELDQRREQELARALEQDLPAFDLDGDVGQTGLFEPGRHPGRLGQAGDVAIERDQAIALAAFAQHVAEQVDELGPRPAQRRRDHRGAAEREHAHHLPGRRARIAAPATARLDTDEIGGLVVGGKIARLRRRAR